ALLEPACLACSGLATVAAFLLFLRLLRGYAVGPLAVDLISVAAFLGTPVWFYGRSLFMESFLLLFVPAAYTLALVPGGTARDGAFGLLFSPRWGLSFFAPAAALAVICWPGYLRRHPREGAMLGGLLLLSFLLFANWGGWYGMAFGPRYLVPVLPMLFVPLVAA